MKRITIRLKITLWFSALLLAIVALTYIVIFSVSDYILQRSIRDNLIEMVEGNVDEIEFYKSLDVVQLDNDDDLYLHFNDGFLEIDDDYLDNINGISTALYQSDGTLLYGENPISKQLQNTTLIDGTVQKQIVSGTVWYVFDRQLTQNGLDGLWLRGVVSAETESLQLSSIARFALLFLPMLLLIAIAGGYIIASRALKPVKQIITTASQIHRGRDLKKRIAIGSGTDEVHQLAESFNQMFDRLDESFETEQQFTSDVSHELRTPMSVIMAQCEYTLENDRTSAEYRNAINVIRRQGGKMTKLIDDMLAFTRLERKAEQIEMFKLNFSDLVASVSEDMALIRDKKINLSSFVDPNICIIGNADLLRRLLHNLIGNAYRYGKENGHIVVSLQSQDESACLSVSDDGIGIAKKDQNHLFQRFFQADQARSGSGTGLGLSMAQEIAQIHGSQIRVKSELGVGSTFSIKLKKV